MLTIPTLYMIRLHITISSHNALHNMPISKHFMVTLVCVCVGGCLCVCTPKYIQPSMGKKINCFYSVQTFLLYKVVLCHCHFNIQVLFRCMISCYFKTEMTSLGQNYNNVTL